MSHTLTIGKLRGLRALANARGVFTMVAEDQRNALRAMINANQPDQVSAAQLTEVKLDICRALSPHASAVLLDPEFGAAQAIASDALAGACGLLVSLEDSSYEHVGEDRRLRLLPDWSVAKIKRMGATAVKVNLYYRPDRGAISQEMQAMVAQIGATCQQEDIPFILEVVGYAVGGMQTGTAAYAAIKGDLVIESARQLSGLGVDVYKAEFPGDAQFEQDEAKLLDACQRLNAACQVPWVLLSAGVDIGVFRPQVALACRAGASGFLGGRAIWKDAIHLSADERRAFLATQGVANLQSLIDQADANASSWEDRANPGFTRPTIDEIWFRSY